MVEQLDDCSKVTVWGQGGWWRVGWQRNGSCYPTVRTEGGGRGAADQLAYTDADTVRQIIIIRGEFWREKSVCMSVSTITKQQLAISCYIWRSFCAHFLPPAK